MDKQTTRRSRPTTGTAHGGLVQRGEADVNANMPERAVWRCRFCTAEWVGAPWQCTNCGWITTKEEMR
jgi:rubrerythrin